MKKFSAKSDLGICVCGLRVETGELAVMVDGRAVHAQCERKAQQSAAAEGLTVDHWREQFLFSDMQREALNRAQEVVTNSTAISFDGETIRAVDIPRLAGQVARVFEFMSDSQWRTLKEIADACDCLETSASARLRDLRKERFGSHQVLSRQISTSPLVYEYRVIINEPNAGDSGEQQQAA